MARSDEMRRCLETLDVEGARRLWAHIAPHLDQPKDNAEALVSLHRARTEAKSIPLFMRLYSHRWLEDQGFPSGLPDNLKPPAERVYPQTVVGVGISVSMREPSLRSAGTKIRKAMEDAVWDAQAEGRLADDDFVRARMLEARTKARKQLFG